MLDELDCIINRYLRRLLDVVLRAVAVHVAFLQTPSVHQHLTPIMRRSSRVTYTYKCSLTCTDASESEITSSPQREWLTTCMDDVRQHLCGLQVKRAVVTARRCLYDRRQIVVPGIPATNLTPELMNRGTTRSYVLLAKSTSENFDSIGNVTCFNQSRSSYCCPLHIQISIPEPQIVRAAHTSQC
jgi:hypothetical protein